jgi:hypothetical protein
VTSVIAVAPAATACSAASRFSVVITATAASIRPSVAFPRFAAVDATPPPTGLVRKSESPARAVELRTRRSGWTTPVMAIPYFGSRSSIEWPPTTATPAAAATSPPPRRISRSASSPSSSSEYATRLSAVTGRAPIA